MNKILEYLDELYKNPKCELNYSKDYELLIAIVLSAQSTDKRVNKVTKILFDKYSNIDSLYKASIADIEQIIKPVGTYHRKAIYIHEIASSIIKNNYNEIPNDREYIESLSGVGRKTANVFLSIIYNEPTIAVDTHVARVSKRLNLVNDDDSVEIIEKKLMKKIPKDKWGKVHLQLVLFGRYHCKAKNPMCNNCKLINKCKKRS